MIDITYKTIDTHDDQIENQTATKRFNTFNEIDTLTTNKKKITKINCSSCFLYNLPQLHFPNITDFDCSFNNITKIHNNNFPNALSNLTYFDCSWNDIRTMSLDNLDFSHISKLQYFNCGHNKLTHIPNHISNLINLKTFICNANEIEFLNSFHLTTLVELDCSRNKIKTLPDNICIHIPNIQTLNFYENKLECLPPNFNFSKLQTLNCINNQIKYLPSNMHLPNLLKLYFGFNELKNLPENITLPSLQILYLYNNQLTSLPQNFHFPNLIELYCSNNQLSSIPLCILNCRQMKTIYYSNNPMDINMSPQILRFINKINNATHNQLNIYNDNQNIHNTSIQLSVKQSINNVTTRTDLPKFDHSVLITIILNNNKIIGKEQLIEYCMDKTEHSVLLLTFEEVLWFVIQTIEHDFDDETKDEIYNIFNQEMKDAECKCFTGRLNRVINCLNGFSRFVNIHIHDSEQIANIIYIVKERLGKEYSVEKHIEYVRKELEERGYSDNIIQEWIQHIN